MTAADSAFELAVSRLSARARVLERALHDPGPWVLTVGGEGMYFRRAPLRREILAPERRIILTAYIEQPSGFTRGTVWCRSHMVTVVGFPSGIRDSCRIVIGIGLREMAGISE